MIRNIQDFYKSGKGITTLFGMMMKFVFASKITLTDLLEFELYLNKEDVERSRTDLEKWRVENGPEIVKMFQKRISVIRGVLEIIEGLKEKK